MCAQRLDRDSSVILMSKPRKHKPHFDVNCARSRKHFWCMSRVRPLAITVFRIVNIQSPHMLRCIVVTHVQMYGRHLCSDVRSTHMFRCTVATHVQMDGRHSCSDVRSPLMFVCTVATHVHMYSRHTCSDVQSPHMFRCTDPLSILYMIVFR
jgi:hypothetical protein